MTLASPLWRIGAVRWVRSAGGLAVAVIALVLVPRLFSASTLTTVELVVVAVLFATSTNLLVGTGGIPTFGQAAFYGAGAYCVGILAPHLPDVLAALGVATVVGAAVGLVMSLFVFRVRGLAFVMVTLAVAQIMYTVLLQNNLFGGYDGLAGILPGSIGGWSADTISGTWYLIGTVVILAMAVLRWVHGTPFVRSLTAVREDPTRALYLHISPSIVQRLAMVISAAGTALAGALSAYATTTVSASSLYWTTSAGVVVMCVLGGRRRFWGPAVGAVIYTVAVQELGNAWTWYLIPLGGLVIIVVMGLPEGLVGFGQRAIGWLELVARRWSGMFRDPGAASVETAAPTAELRGSMSNVSGRTVLPGCTGQSADRRTDRVRSTGLVDGE